MSARARDTANAPPASPLGALFAVLLTACTTSTPPSPPPPQPAVSLITFGQVFDQGAACPALNVPFVWADNKPCLAAPGVIMGQYAAAYRLITTSLETLYQTRPDVIAYQGDGRTVALEFGDTCCAPVDITNPAAETLQLAEIVAGARGRTQVDLDNVDAEQAPYVGAYVGARGPCAVADRPACGGTWTPRFTGRPNDPAWGPANVAHVQRMTAALAAKGVAVMINNTANSTAIAVADHEALASAAGASMIEGWPIDGCADDPGSGWFAGYSADAQFDREYREMADESARPTFMIAYLCGHSLAQATPREIAYVTAARLLTMREPSVNYLAFGGAADLHGVETYPANPAIGPITDPPPAAGSRPYVRKFAHGVVCLNPSSTQTLTGCGVSLAPMTAVMVAQ